MSRFRYSLMLVLAVVSGACARNTPETATPTGGGAPRPRAVFVIFDTLGNRSGEVTGSEAAGSALLEIVVRGLTPGEHGLHLHAAPLCEAPTFQSAGSHFNPSNAKHGTQNPEGPHAGDLPNLIVTPDGVGRAQISVPGWTLAGGPRSIGQPGTSLVIHADRDDGRTDPTGNSGARLGCAVIKLP